MNGLDLKIYTDNIEGSALDQIYTLAKQPAFSGAKIRIMPDVHAGKGCVIGFTADLGEKVIPNIVGVDIGCGMLTVMLGNIEIDYSKLDGIIHNFIPSGQSVSDKVSKKMFDLQELYCFKGLKNHNWLKKSLGTLGGGNHFIEVDKDEDRNKYLIIHTGSRNLGKQVAEIYQNIAIDTLKGRRRSESERKNLIEQYKKEGRQREISDALKHIPVLDEHIPSDLCYLEGENRENYLHDMRLCQSFARMNRDEISKVICSKMGWMPIESFHTVHNYIDDSNIVRKGAVSAKDGELLLIPINMRDGCILAVGKGNEDWNNSAPHGAGRLLSRSKAKECLDLDEYKMEMEGIFSTSVSRATIDESPMAYKSINEILELIQDTVFVKKILKPIYNFKSTV